MLGRRSADRGRRRARDVVGLLAGGAEAGAPAVEDPYDDLDRAVRGLLERLGQSEAAYTRLCAAVDAVGDAVIVAGRSGEAVLRNRAAAQLLDDGPTGPLLEEALTACLEEAGRDGAVSRELSFYGPPPRDLFLRARPLRIEGAVAGVVAVIEDVSAARRVDSVRTDFVANVSHELRTPIGALALLGETIAAAVDPAVSARLAERIVREAERLGRIVDDLLDLSVIEAERSPLSGKVPVGTVVAEAVDQVRAVAEAAGTPIEVVGSSDGLTVRGDQRQIVSAVVNLLDNAVKYSEPGSPVEVRTQSAGGRVAIEVRDHGIGIPSSDLERVFERFYRVDRARSRESGGTGLGLSIVRHVAAAHGGEIVLESQEGVGSTFRMVLPASEDRIEGPDA